MADETKKMDPWQLIAAVLTVGAIFLGLYITNMASGARFDALETAINANANSLEMIHNTVIQKANAQAAILRDAAPAPEAAAGEAVADSGDAAADSGDVAADGGEAAVGDAAATGDAPAADEAKEAAAE